MNHQQQQQQQQQYHHPNSHKKSSSSTAARKITPTSAGKAWKENLRRACLDRARRRRRLPDDASFGSEAAAADPASSRNQYLYQEHQQQQQQQNNNNNPNAAVRQMVEEELFQQAIAIVPSPGFSCPHNDEGPMRMDSATSTFSSSHHHHRLTYQPQPQPQTIQNYISEDELLALLQEVEREMELFEARRADELWELAQRERQDLQDRVTEFEQWQDEQRSNHHGNDNPNNNNGDDEPAVLCPICHEANLMVLQCSDDEDDDDETCAMNTMIVCPNRMDGSCALQLPAPSAGSSSSSSGMHHNDDLRCGCCWRSHSGCCVLHSLQERLRSAYEEHALHCHHYLLFDMQERDGHLRATCAACATALQIA